MRSRPFVIMLNVIIIGSVKEADLLSNQVVTFIQRTSITWLYGGIFKKCSFWTVRNSWSLLISIAIKFCHLKISLDKKYPSLVNRKVVILHHNNTDPQKALLTKDLFEALGLEKLLHPSYSPDPASDYPLFRGLQNYSNGLRLTWRENIEHVLTLYFASKPNEFCWYGIHKFVDRWNEVLGSNEGYIND